MLSVHVLLVNPVCFLLGTSIHGEKGLYCGPVESLSVCFDKICHFFVLMNRLKSPLALSICDWISCCS